MIMSNSGFKRYIDQVLAADEPVLFDAKVHWAIFIKPALSLLVFLVLAISFGVTHIPSLIKNVRYTEEVIVTKTSKILTQNGAETVVPSTEPEPKIERNDGPAGTKYVTRSGHGSFTPFFTIFMVVTFFSGVVGMVNAAIYYFNSDFVLTDRRVLSKFGLLSRTTSEQRLSKVESIHVHQSIVGRILGYGRLTVTGTGSSTTQFSPMADPLACKRAIEAELDRIRA
jgi:hypothetical protein